MQQGSNVSSKLLPNLPAIDQSQSITIGPSGVTLKPTFKKKKKPKIVKDKFLSSLARDAREGLQKILEDSRCNHEAYEKSLRVPKDQQSHQRRHRSADLKLRGLTEPDFHSDLEKICENDIRCEPEQISEL
jgi:hypothetical protein